MALRQVQDNTSPFLKNIIVGEVAEWLKAAVLKTVKDREVLLEFESLPLRQSSFNRFCAELRLVLGNEDCCPAKLQRENMEAKQDSSSPLKV